MTSSPDLGSLAATQAEDHGELALAALRSITAVPTSPSATQSITAVVESDADLRLKLVLTVAAVVVLVLILPMLGVIVGANLT